MANFKSGQDLLENAITSITTAGGGIITVSLACVGLIFLNEKYESTSETRNYNIGGNVKSKIAYGFGISCFVLSRITLALARRSMSLKQEE